MEWQTRMSFNDSWKIIVASKRRGNKKNLSHDEYQDRITLVHQLKEQVRIGEVAVSAKNLRILNKFNVISRGGSEWLVKPSPLEDTGELLLYVSNEELFDVLHEAHLESNHGTAEQMLNKIRLRYCNVTREAVSIYLGLCPHCRNPRGEDAVRAISPNVVVPMSPTLPIPPTVQVSAPPRSSSQLYVTFGLWVYFGFVDMRHLARDGYTYIMVHWDIGSRFIHLMPLQSTHHVNVAVSLMDIYATFGVPYFLDAPYNIQYIKAIINHIKSVWTSEVSINHRTSDDINEMINGLNIVYNLLRPWLSTEKFKNNWPSEVKRIQLAINSLTFSGSSSSPLTRPPSDINLWV